MSKRSKFISVKSEKKFSVRSNDLSHMISFKASSPSPSKLEIHEQVPKREAALLHSMVHCQ